ncbi:MAG TPA: hypothetical protein VGI77_07175 [Gaiellaceae bacterium]|jgi:hypothetical protein
MKHRFFILVATIVAVAVIAPVAFAGGPSDTQYPSASGLVAGTSTPRQTKPTKPLPTKPTGTLPFTGANLAAAGAIGVLLAVGGITLTLVSRRRSTGE